MKTVTTMPDTGQLELPLGDYVDPGEVKGETLQERFERFHAANRWVYYSLVMLTEDWIAHGHQRASIDMFMHVLRYQYGRQTTGDHGFKLNNNTTSRYARKLIAEHPEWSAIFYTRQLRSE